MEMIINNVIQKLTTELSNNNCFNLYYLLTVIIPLFTFIAAIYIPRKIMVDQRFASLTEQYRSPEMGFAIYRIFNFYQKNCQNNPDNIKKEYIKRFNREIKIPLAKKEGINPSHTLQFQRRLVAYFYWDLARLYFESRFPRLKNKNLYQMVEKNERQLINLILQMSEANAECFAKYENINESPDDDVPMNQFLKRLYDETEEQI
jgi:hypothetical protein